MWVWTWSSLFTPSLSTYGQFCQLCVALCPLILVVIKKKKKVSFSGVVWLAEILGLCLESSWSFLVSERILKMWSLRAQRLNERMSEVLFSNCMHSDIWCGLSWLEEGITALKCLTRFPLWGKGNYFAALAKKTGWHWDTWICIFGAKWVPAAAVVEPDSPAPVWKAFPPRSAGCCAQTVLALWNSVFTQVNPRSETRSLLFYLRPHAVIDMVRYRCLIANLVNLDYIVRVSVTQ